MAVAVTGMMTALKWRDIAVEQIKKSLSKHKVHDTYALIRSVQMYIQATGADSYKATLLYNYYGIFPDMGVGKGVSFGETSVAKLSGSRRKRKNWTKEIAHQRHRFGEVMASRLADSAVEKVSTSIREVRVVNINL